MAIKKIRIGVTGGIGSGKSAFCGYLTEQGYPVIQADDVAKEVLEKDPFVKKKLISAFGSRAYHEEKPDSRFLAEKVFANPENLKKMNSIVHPVTIRKISGIMKSLLKLHDIVIVEAALIFEAQMEEMFDYVVLVTADEDLRVKRAAARMNVDENKIRRRMSAQIPDEEKKEWADFTFVNDNGPEELKEKSLFFLNLIKTIGGIS